MLFGLLFTPQPGCAALSCRFMSGHKEHVSFKPYRNRASYRVQATTVHILYPSNCAWLTFHLSAPGPRLRPGCAQGQITDHTTKAGFTVTRLKPSVTKNLYYLGIPCRKSLYVVTKPDPEVIDMRAVPERPVMRPVSGHERTV